MVASDSNNRHNRSGTGAVEANSESGSPVGRRRFLQAAGAGTAVALAGCSGGGDGGPVTPGATYILSGFASLYGEEAERDIEFAQSETNENGGIDGRDVEVIVMGESVPETDADLPLSTFEALVADADQMESWPPLSGDDPAGMCYTSGTTGKPKDVECTHKMLYAHAMMAMTPAALDIAEAVVVAASHERWRERPLAFVVPKAGRELDVEAVRAFLADEFPRWWLPDDVRFREGIPKTATGKFDKKTLRETVEDPDLPYAPGEGESE